MSIPQDMPELLLAQYRAFSQQLPLMYVILMSNSWILAISYLHAAPLSLSVACPVALTVVCAARLLGWWNGRKVQVTPATAGAALKRTNLLSGLLAAGFSAWAISLYPYGDAAMQSHVAFYMAITVIGCIFSLVHLRPAALTVAVVVNTVFVVFFISTGNPTYIAMAINVVMITGSMLVILLVSYRDFTALVASRQALELTQQKTLALSNENFRLANLDSLTELANRRSFFSRLDAAVAQAASTGGVMTLGILDLDGFKPINDTYGHPVGDALLVQLADRLSAACGRHAEPFRLGGDEFALIFSGTDIAEVMEHAYDICAAIRAPFVLRNCTARISSTIGLATYPALASNSQELFERADYALYQAKRSSGRGEAWLFTEADEANIRRSSVVENTLKGANLDDELSLMFQPIVDVRTGQPVGFEALARWASPELGQVSPGEFIPIAERAGIVTKLTPVLLRKALATAATWPSKVRLSFNLSVFDISDPEALLQIVSAICNSGVSPRRIDLEITETAMVNDFAQIMAGVDTLKALGVGISLDDFGTGYSGLRHVHQLPLDKLKIDRSFVTDIDTNPASHKIVKSLMTLCNDLKLTCIVEGVETAEELAVLRDLGCHLIQGYHCGRPMTPTDAIHFIKHPSARQAV